jgi:EAL domain-containing protein (putative c-di-GMP-specific phosphodiesterase class I)
VAVEELVNRRLAFERALAGGLQTVFQQIVALEDRSLVGFEALTRGPTGSVLERPGALFAEARRQDRLAELDWRCRLSAIETAHAAGLARPLTLFVNVEPDSLRSPLDPRAQHVWETARDRLSVVLEVTERALIARPAELLLQLEEARELGWRIAVDDIGADARSLALMPFLHPDLLKLDLRLVQQQPSRELAKIVNAVRAEAERSGAEIVAEGIEHERHLETAHALGATLGQGFLFGRPEPLEKPPTGPGLSTQTRVNVRVPAAPFELVATSARTRISRKPLLIEISKQLESEALEIGATATVVASFQEAQFFTPRTRERYERLSEQTGFVAALAAGLPREPATGVRGITLAASDPVVGEWTIAVISPHFAACLAARDLGDNQPDHQRRFEYALTFDRTIAVAAAQSLLTRVSGPPATRHARQSATRVPSRQ